MRPPYRVPGAVADLGSLFMCQRWRRVTSSSLHQGRPLVGLGYEETAGNKRYGVSFGWGYGRAHRQGGKFASLQVCKFAGTFGLWLSWRRPGGSVVPMTVLGDQAERVVADRLARSGFELVYQSRGSRGAFDLLATRGAQQLGVQVKRSPLPLRFPREQWNRLSADARRFGWPSIVAAVSADDLVVLLDPSRPARGRTIALHASAAIDNIVTWVDTAP